MKTLTRMIMLPVVTGLLVSGASVAAHGAQPLDARVERDQTGAATVRWADGGSGNRPVDVFVSARADATPRTATLISGADSDGQELLPADGPQRTYVLLRDVRSGQVTRVAERVLPLAQGSNFRDIGGYRTADGHHVRWGRIYRAGATPMVTDSDIARIKGLGLVDMIDLRSSEERVLAPTRLTGIRYTAIDYSMQAMMPTAAAGSIDMIGLYHNMPAFLAPQLKIVFSDLLLNKGPILYHCSAGQDRTGVTSAIVLAALGVPRETILADYHLSTTYRRPQYEMPRISPEQAAANPTARMFAGYQNAPGAAVPQPLKTKEGRAYLEGALEEIDTRWGSVDGFLKAEIGLTAQDIRQLRAAYTE
ncbi:MAG: hypothetical protein RLZZ08_568 [Pseudomonadota bacterium]